MRSATSIGLAQMALLFLMPTLSPAALEAAARPLFNGSDLSGWVEEPSQGAFSAGSGEIVLSAPRNAPGWLRTEKIYENFHLSLEYLMPGWCETGILLHAPRYGRPSRAGIKIHLRHNNEDEGVRSLGSIYDVLPPMTEAAVERNQWNRLEITLDWPYLKVTINGEVLQDVNMEHHPDLRWRLRSGYIGIQDLGTRARFRNLEIDELPGREQWQQLFNGDDLSGWHVQGEAPWSVDDGRITAGGGDGYLITDRSFSSFVFQVYVRASKLANGGVFIRWNGAEGRGYEIQIYNVDDATNPTGSIYGIVPSLGSTARDEAWFLLQIISDRGYAAAFVDGEKVAESFRLRLPDIGRIALQMHSRDARIEFLEPRIMPIH